MEPSSLAAPSSPSPPCSPLPSVAVAATARAAPHRPRRSKRQQAAGASSSSSSSLTRRQHAEFRLYTESIAANIPHILHTALPTQILCLHSLILSLPPYTQRPLPLPSPPLPPYRPPSYAHLDKSDPASYRSPPRPPSPPCLCYLPAHPLLLPLHHQFRPCLVQLYGLLSSLSHFLHLSLPSLDDTSNSNLNIPQTAMRSVLRQQRFLAPLLSQSSTQYAAQRAALLEQAVKYGWEENYVRAIEEWDESEYVRLRNSVRELRGRMLVCWDFLTKHEQRLTEDRSHDLQIA